MKKLIATSLLCWCFSATVLAQINTNDMDKRLTPSPTVASLGTFGGVEIKKSTGGVSKSIPLFQLKQGSISYAPTIEYFSTGTRINDWGGRLGIGWTDNFTATIQRVIRSVPDEYATRYDQREMDDFFDTESTYEYLDSISTSTEFGSGIDTEYDLFSYNIFGQSGSFILKDSLPVLLNHSDTVEIEVLSTFPYAFSITSADGMKYFFGLDSTIEYASNNNENLCDEDAPHLFDQTTAWFLNKIISPTKDTLHFNYGTFQYNYVYDFSETAHVGLLNDANHNSDYNHQACAREKWTSTKYLQSVEGTNFNLTFEYGAYRLDLEGDKLLTKINLYDPANNLIRTSEFAFDTVVSTKFVETKLDQSLSYDGLEETLKKRYFLKSVRLSGTTASPYNEYFFSYNDPHLLPHRFSFSQDMQGYYNGKSNSGFIPADGANAFLTTHNKVTASQYFTAQGYYGNRQLDENSSRVGMLSKIVYPTGGMDTILYEGNSYSTEIEVLTVASPAQDNFTCTDPSGQSDETSISISVPFDQKVKINVSTDYANGTYPYDNDGSINWIDFQLVDQTTGSSLDIPHSSVIYNSTSHTATMKLYEQYGDSVQLISGHNYYLQFYLYGDYTKVSYSIEYYSDKDTVLEEKPYYGQRVKQVITSSLSSPPIVKTYNYKIFAKDGDQIIFSDSTSSVWGKEEVDGFGNYMSVPQQIPPPETNGFPTSTTYFTNYELWRVSSKYQLNTNIFGGAPIAYSCVTEFLDTGKISFSASKFIVMPDREAGWALGDYSPVFPLDNYGWGHGIECNRFYGTKKDEQYKILKELNWNYVGTGNFFTNFVVQKIYDRESINNALADPNAGELSKPYSVVWYPIQTWWYKLDSLSEIDYVPNGQTFSQLFVGQKLRYDGRDKLVSEQETYDSKNQKTIKKFNRPAAMVASSQDPSGIYQNMLNHNILSPVIEEIQTKGNDQVFLKRTNYFSPSTDLFVPEYVQTKALDFQEETRVRFHNYDDRGNILSLSNENDSKICYVWGYAGQYVVAKIINAEYSAVVSALGGSSAIESFKSIATPTDEQVHDFLDALRTDVNLTNSQVQTYTYVPLIGMTSQTDVNNRPIYYEYDAFGRLSLIKDQDGRILKKYCYNYAGQPEDCGMDKAPLWESTGLTRCKPCPSNSAYISNIQQHEEKDNNPYSTSYNTTRWVDDGVSANCVPQADWQLVSTTCQLNSSGQNTGYQIRTEKDMNPCSSSYNTTRQVNVYNTTACPLPVTCSTSNCSGNDRKCINGVCTVGRLVVVSSVWKKVLINGLYQYRWVCTKKYCFADGTLSTYSVDEYNTTGSCPVEWCALEIE